MHPGIQTVTDKIIERSHNSRSAYVQRFEQQARAGRTRAKLSCGNLAHAMAASDADEKDRLAAELVPNLGIISSYNDMLSAHQPYYRFPDLIKATTNKLGGTAQVAGMVPAMCDGVTQGQDGMELSLFSRDVIAMATAVSLSHDMFDGVLALGICDKIVPGLLIGSLSFGHLPTVFIPSGPMPTGQSNADKAKVRQAYAEGKIGRAELLASESASYHSPGTCTFYGTANSNQMLVEIMGLQLPGSSFVPPNTGLRDALTVNAVEQLYQSIIEQQATPIGKIISEKTIVNGLVGLLATGGSTNHAIHLIAVAAAAGIIINWQDMAELSQHVPLLCRIYPNGSADINHFQAAGGMGYLMRELAEQGFLHQDVHTILGEGLAPYFKEPQLAHKKDAEIFREKTELQTKALVWQDAPEKSLESSVLTSCAECFSETGGLELLEGNLGRAVIKVSALKAEQHFIQAPAKVFDSQHELQAAFDRGELEQDFIAVIRFQGPKANGMPELHKLTPLLGVLQDKGFKVAIVTDGRMSGASGKVPAAIHLTPEAVEGGLIAKIHEGDLIKFDANTGELSVQLTDAELDARELATIDEQQTYGLGRELFKSFRDVVSSAEQGATVFQTNEPPHS